MKFPDPLAEAELLAAASALDKTANCRMPGCSKTITFRLVRGRRSRFCSGACRAKYSRERARLRTLWTRLKVTADLPEPPVPPTEIKQLLDHVTWLLEGYGGVDADLRLSVGRRPSRSPVSASRDVSDEELLKVLQDVLGMMVETRETMKRHSDLLDRCLSQLPLLARSRSS